MKTFKETYKISTNLSIECMGYPRYLYTLLYKLYMKDQICARSKYTDAHWPGRENKGTNIFQFTYLRI